MLRRFLFNLRSRYHRLPRWLRFIGGSCAVFGLIGFIAFALVWHHYSSLAATYDMAALTRGQNETLIVDAKGEPIGSASDIERELVTLEDVPISLVQAVIATEDARFFSHPGFDFIGLTRAAVKNFTSRGIRQGGSTITQQLARNAFGLQGRSYERKILEIFLSMRIEREYTKEQILTHYLNRIYLGTGCSGVGAAARCYFGKDVHELSLVESATLAGIIKAPVAFSPITQPALAKQKRDLTLQRMVETGSITEAESTTARALPVVLRHDKARVRTGYMLAAARAEFQRLGLKPGTPPEMTMTLRLSWQHKLDALMRQHLDGLSKDDKALQGAVIVLDNRSGAILAMQGGRDFTTSPFNRALEGVRPPGTAFLPLVYAAALTTQPDVTDAPQIDGPLDNKQAMIGGLVGTLGEWGADGEPVSYTGGTITPMESLLENRTAATVRLAYQVGLDPLRAALNRCGFTTPLRTEAAFALGRCASLSLLAPSPPSPMTAAFAPRRICCSRPPSAAMKSSPPPPPPMCARPSSPAWSAPNTVSRSWHTASRIKASPATAASPTTAPTPGSSAPTAPSLVSCGSVTTKTSPSAPRPPPPPQHCHCGLPSSPWSLRASPKAGTPKPPPPHSSPHHPAPSSSKAKPASSP
jgi:membrane peptidoglycan carboxypeptidase